MSRVAIKVPELASKVTGKYACECEKIPLDMQEKEGLIFWLAELDDWVEEGEPICEGEVQKTTIQISAPCSGMIEKICLEDGDTFKFGDILGYIETEC
ncbi:biotin/lipoyl-containing protein [Sporomusa acidovorans]|uniref:Lipoyl-binding domain-containing protein n=1 Tax=Sporomusa acidovorans (strain ATCC 49682 / DSM 3132 / Mol) TaxID=1123286 RepID=A0ABZ3IXY8_SPOA4|nr:biotin/lipoyl-containing protein [Sporomusa acidovorans]OZC23370.1 branched-chain alpha-keto acid dehydrogenase subunit E2 [Sporomusa acidovorans DSM 3132]SDE43309.1 Biotin-requiring enzyme [Sporomusa acidovorans]